MYCISCGRPIADGSPFCRHCGAKQKLSDTPVQQPAAPVPDPQAPNTPAAGIEADIEAAVAALHIGDDVESTPGAGANPVPSAGSGWADAAPEAPAQDAWAPPRPDPQNPSTWANARPNPRNPTTWAKPEPSTDNTWDAPQYAAQKKSKKPLILTLTAVAVIILAVAGLFGTKAILTARHTPEKTIGQFIEAIQTRDAAALIEISTLNGDGLELSKETLEPFFDLYTGTYSNVSYIERVLLDGADSLKEGLSSKGDGIFRLVKESGFFYDDYMVEITPVTFTAYSEFDGTRLTLGAWDWTVDAQGTKLRVLPGLYSGSAACTAPVTGAILRTQIAERSLSSNQTELWINFDYTGANIDANNQKAGITVRRITVDGNAYTGSLDDIQNGGIYLTPLGPDSEVIVEWSYQDQNFTNSFSVAQQNNLYLDPPGAATTPQAPDNNQPQRPSSTNGYLLPTDSVYITYADLAPFTRTEVMLIRNEIYARHHYTFRTDEVRAYFESTWWYYADPNVNASTFTAQQMTEVERANLETVQNYEKYMGWK